MSPPKNKDNRRLSLPHHPAPTGTGGGPPSGLTQQEYQVDPTTTPEEWDRIEEQYWKDARKAADLEDISMGEKYRDKTAPIRARYAPLLEQRVRLKDELDRVKQLCDEVEDELTQIDMHFFEAKDIIEKRRINQNTSAQEFFGHYKELARRHAAGMGKEGDERRLQAAATDIANGSMATTPASDDTAVDEAVGNGSAAIHSSGPASLLSSPLSQPPEDIADYTGAEIYTMDGKFIDHVKKIRLDNRHVRNILQIPLKRHAVVRNGRKFTKETMDSIYEPSDVKGAKWLSCMIQARGEEQEVACQSCQSRNGIWAGCVIVGGEDFPRCANCEWNRQGCVGSSYHQERIQDPDLQQAPQSPYIVEASAHASREGSTAHGFTPVNGAAMRPSTPATAPPKRTILPTMKGSRKSLPNMAPAVGSYDDSIVDGNEIEQADPGPEIIKGSLHLEHDGTVFTAPEIMRGVPIERISPSHPYWDEKWEEVEPSIRAKLTEWEAKLAECLATQPKKRFLAQRQVNRGRTILEFLQNGPIHPYQLVGKKFISKALISYDTVFRLAQVIEELPKFGVDIPPVDWVRERLHELHNEEGERFTLSRTVHDLYRDPKLQFLRNRAGFGNIGRPCGVKKGMTSKYPGGIRVKDPHLPPPPRNKRGPAQDGKVVAKKARIDIDNGATPGPFMKSETASPSNLPLADHPDLDDGYTSVDSSSGDGITPVDWRMLEVKTDHRRTNQKFTQYWHFVRDDQDPHFEHQFMTQSHPPTWQVYGESYFDLRLEEIMLIQYCIPKCLKLVIHTNPMPGCQPRGRFIVRFKRLRTIKRFINFLRHSLGPIRTLAEQEAPL